MPSREKIDFTGRIIKLRLYFGLSASIVYLHSGLCTSTRMNPSEWTSTFSTSVWNNLWHLFSSTANLHSLHAPSLCRKCVFCSHWLESSLGRWQYCETSHWMRERKDCERTLVLSPNTLVIFNDNSIQNPSSQSPSSFQIQQCTAILLSARIQS